MATKNFKSGLGSLIQDTRLNSEPVEEPKVAETPKEEAHEAAQKIGDAELLIRIHQLERELGLWRSGQLNQTKFRESLKKNKLKYNTSSNSIEGI